MNTVKRSELSTLRMAAGNEKKYPAVIDGGMLKEWVGIGWINLGPATEEDRAKHPVVKDEPKGGYSVGKFLDTDTNRARWAVAGPGDVWYFPRRYGAKAAHVLCRKLNSN